MQFILKTVENLQVKMYLMNRALIIYTMWCMLSVSPQKEIDFQVMKGPECLPVWSVHVLPNMHVKLNGAWVLWLPPTVQRNK